MASLAYVAAAFSVLAVNFTTGVVVFAASVVASSAAPCVAPR